MSDRVFAPLPHIQNISRVGERLLRSNLHNSPCASTLLLRLRLARRKGREAFTTSSPPIQTSQPARVWLTAHDYTWSCFTTEIQTSPSCVLTRCSSLPHKFDANQQSSTRRPSLMPSRQGGITGYNAHEQKKASNLSITQRHIDKLNIRIRQTEPMNMPGLMLNAGYGKPKYTNIPSSDNATAVRKRTTSTAYFFFRPTKRVFHTSAVFWLVSP